MKQAGELTENTYVYGVWHWEVANEGASGNVMMHLEREGDGPWIGIIRIRFYRDDKVFESSDERKWFQVTAPPGESVETFKAMLDKTAKNFPERKGKVTYVEIKGDHLTLLEKLGAHGEPFHVGMQPGGPEA